MDSWRTERSSNRSKEKKKVNGGGIGGINLLKGKGVTDIEPANGELA